jgi:hypothetical protein
MFVMSALHPLRCNTPPVGRADMPLRCTTPPVAAPWCLHAHRSVFNKLANFTPAEISSTLAALAALRYRNPWLLDHTSKILVSTRMRKAYLLTPQELAHILASCRQLGYVNPLLLGHLGSVAAESQLQGCTPGELASVLAGFERIGFNQPQLLQAAATKLLQLVVQHESAQPTVSATAATPELSEQEFGTEAVTVGLRDPQQQQQQQQQQWGSDDLTHLIAAAWHLACMPPAAGSTAERAALPAALLGLTVQALETCRQQQLQAGSSSSSSSSKQSACSLQDLLLLLSALLLQRSSAVASSFAAYVAPGPSRTQQQQQQQQQHVPLVQVSQQQQQQQQQHVPLVQVSQQLLDVQQHLQGLVQQHVAEVVARYSDTAAAVGVLNSTCPGLLQCMQLLWSLQQSQAAAAAAAAAGLGTVQWSLGVPDELVGVIVQQQQDHLVLQQKQQQKQQQLGKRPVLRAVAAALARVLQPAGPSQQQQQQQQQPVQLMYCIPNSPMIVPIAVLPVRSTSPAHTSTAAAASGGQRQDNSDQEQPAAGVFAHVQAQLHLRKLKLPAEAQQQIIAGQQSRRAIAVFVANQPAQTATAVGPAAVGLGEGGDGHGAVVRWFTQNAPQQLLPAAQVWQKGLLAAGWDVLLLEDLVLDSAEDD